MNVSIKNRAYCLHRNGRKETLLKSKTHKKEGFIKKLFNVLDVQIG
jgi:hypothetical protein